MVLYEEKRTWGKICNQKKNDLKKVKNIIVESEKPRKHTKEKNVEAAIEQLKKELSSLEIES